MPALSDLALAEGRGNLSGHQGPPERPDRGARDEAPAPLSVEPAMEVWLPKSRLPKADVTKSKIRWEYISLSTIIRGSASKSHCATKAIPLVILHPTYIGLFCFDNRI